jgi:hypothetical protein
MVNYEDTVVLARRIPVRGWKIGLTNGNLKIVPVGEANYMFDELLTSPELSKTIQNKFPPLKTAIERLANDSTFMAFSRRFALSYNQGLYFKDYGLVGEWDYNDQLEYELDRPYQYLNEMLGEDIQHAQNR